MGAAGFDELAHQVAAGGGLDGIEIGKRGVEEAEPVVVPCGKAGVFHAGLLCQPDPIFDDTVSGAEPVGEQSILYGGNPLVIHGPLAPVELRVKAVMNEHPKAVVPEALNRSGRRLAGLCCNCCIQSLIDVYRLY